MKTIQSKILLVVISALVVITALVSVIAFSISHEILHRDADRILNNVAMKEAAQINEMFNDFEKSAAITRHYTASELENVEAMRDEAYLDSYLQRVRHLFDEIAVNTSGTYSYYLCFSPELTGKTVGFYTQFNEDGSVYELSKEEFSKLSLLTDEELIAYSNHSGEVQGEWLEPHASRFTGESVISYLVPVYSQDTFIAILGFNMDFDYLLDRVNGIDVYEYGTALLLGPHKKVIYNPSRQTVMESEFTEATAVLKNGMYVELRAAYLDIQSGLRPMLNWIIIAFLIVLFFAILYTFWVTNKIVGPLKKLTEIASGISSGVQDTNLVVESNDEIGVLSRVLNDTYAKIKEYSMHINALAYRDSLTGIKNSTAYTEAIEELNKEINLGNPAFGVLVADINNLKQANDTYGHDIGNELIVHAARVLTDTFKTSPVFRIGGDEFVVLLKGLDLEKYRARLDKLNEALSDKYISVHDDTICVSIAKGVAIYDPMIDRVYTDVFAKADYAMYMNKSDMKAALQEVSV